MEQHNSRVHARRIVQDFRNELSDEVQASIGELGFGNLEMMIESALSTQVSDALEKTVADLEGVISQAKKRMIDAA